MDKPARFFADIRQALQKKPPIVIIHENCRTVISPRHHVIKTSLKLQSNASCHGPLREKNITGINLKMKGNAH